MLKRHKDLLRAIVAALRATLAGAASADGAWQRGDLDRELERLGIAPDGKLTPLDMLPNASPTERRARYAAEAAITTAINGLKSAAAERKRSLAREEVVERAAYTWINRLLALRTLEARGLIDETLRNNPDYDGVSEALFILRSDAPSYTAGADGGWQTVVAKACKSQATAFPGLFDLNDPAAALHPSPAALLRCITLVGAAPNGYTLEEADTAFADPDAIGWAYQFYQEAAKVRVYAKLFQYSSTSRQQPPGNIHYSTSERSISGNKIATRAEIAAATQLFTEPYMVQWLLQNSLGRAYHEAYPESALPETWDYYIRQRPEGQASPEATRPLHALDLIDPCCGSGHFLREAFDMFATMYCERHPELSASAIADRILTRHLHGIDLDPRAAQLAALTLYLRAWEFVRADARRQHRPLSSVIYHPPALNIATTPSGLSTGALQRHLRRHPEDRVMKPLLEGVFAALEQADILGSLLRPAEHIDAAIKALQQPHTIEMDFDADDAALRRTITALAHSDPAELKRILLDRVAQSFHAEAGNADDVAAQLFGREAEGGVRLLQLLDRKYAVVATNPPYMGSGNMDTPLKRYIEQHYKPGKRDIYAAFILRCLELCRAPLDLHTIEGTGGRVAMITQQSWMFLRSFAELRAVPEEKLADARKKGQVLGLLRESTIEALAHLGPNSFEEISGEVVQNVMFVLANAAPHPEHRMTALRLVGLKSGAEKARVLREAAQ
ncbi:MAG: BREX-1 system adenine-specific DNA-methyltransferase PglX [Chloroflexales bacterium]|nr:BREX-1 system adenine-specific DNA-methyltransferase PglX [Chloroflexales bacterium]